LHLSSPNKEKIV